MGSVYQRPSSNNNYNNRQTNPRNTGSAVIGRVIGSIVLAAAGCAAIFLVLSIITAITSLTYPAIINAFIAFSVNNTINLNTCLILLIEGALAGLFIGYIKKIFKLKSKFGESFLSELFSFSAFKRDPTFASILILDLLVGATVGWLAGAAGSVGLFTLIFGNYNAANAIASANPSPIAIIVLLGGAGGAGSGSGFFGGIFFLILLIILVFVIQGIVVGATSGLTFGMLAGAIYNAIREGSLSSLVCLVDEKDSTIKKGRLMLKALRKGVIEGAIVGGIVGLIQGIITTVAFREFLHR